MSDRKRARELAKDFIQRQDPLGWFEPLYREAKTNWSLVPWADLAPNPNLLAWQARNRVDGKRKRALNVGCGLGDDAEELASWEFQVVAIDISSTAISLCRERFPSSPVDYCRGSLRRARSLACRIRFCPGILHAAGFAGCAPSRCYRAHCCFHRAARFSTCNCARKGRIR